MGPVKPAPRRRGGATPTDGQGGVRGDLDGGPGSRYPYRVTPGRAGCSAGPTGMRKGGAGSPARPGTRPGIDTGSEAGFGVLLDEGMLERYRVG